MSFDPTDVVAALRFIDKYAGLGRKSEYIVQYGRLVLPDKVQSVGKGGYISGHANSALATRHSVCGHVYIDW